MSANNDNENEAIGTTRQRLEEFINQITKRVRELAGMEKNIGLLDSDRQFNRYEPFSDKDGYLDINPT